MNDILLHSSKIHREAKRFRKNYKPSPNSVAHGVQEAIKLIKQTNPVKHAPKS